MFLSIVVPSVRFQTTTRAFEYDIFVYTEFFMKNLYIYCSLFWSDTYYMLTIWRNIFWNGNLFINNPLLIIIGLL